MGLGAASDYRPVVYHRLAGKTNIAGEYAMVADDAVVCDVNVRHDKGVVADPGDELAAGLGAAVDGCAFADCDIVPEFDVCDFTFVLEVLGDRPDHCPGEYVAVATHLYVLENGGVREDPAAVADLDVVIDVCEGPDFDVVAELGLWTYICLR